MVAIPYTDIRDADFRQNDLLDTRIYLRVAATDGEIREISIPLHLLERDDRANATEALEKKGNKVALEVYENYDHNLSSNSSDKMEEIFFKTVDFISENI